MNFIETLKYRNELLFYFGAVCLAAAVIFLVLGRLSPLQVGGVNAWIKPFKFAVSIMAYSWAMAWYCAYLPEFNITRFNWTVVMLLGFELAYIALQAGRGQLSHFNMTSALYQTLFQLMGLAAVAVTLYTAYVGYLFFAGSFPDLPAAYLWGIRLGIVIFVVFSLEGGVMGARMAHTVGGADGGAGIALLNWSVKYGDLRVAHFVGMHALQVLPLLGFYVLRQPGAIFVAAACYGLLALLVLIQALAGKPFYRF